MKKLRPIFGFKVESQLSVWMTSAVECVEGFGRKDLQLSVQLRVVEKICS